MTRRPPVPPLLSIQEPPIYVVDSSAWIDLAERPDAPQLWVLVEALIGQGRLFTIREVMNELEANPLVMDRVKQWEAALLKYQRNDADYMMAAGAVAYRFRRLAKIRSAKKRPADPWVIAFAQLEGMRVVANESKKRPSQKIIGACALLGVLCVTLDELVAAESGSPTT